MPILKRSLAAAAMFFAATVAASAWPASVSTDLNMRAGPGTNHRVLMVLPRGATVDVRHCERNWCQVTYGNRAGFASERYLVPLRARQPAPPPVFSPRPPFWGGPPRAPRRACNEARVQWAYGRRADERIVEQAMQDANARVVRVIRPGDFYTQELRRDRLNIEVNRRNRIVDLRCG